MKSFLISSEFLSHLLSKPLPLGGAWRYGVVYVFRFFFFLNYEVLMGKKSILFFHAKHVAHLA